MAVLRIVPKEDRPAPDGALRLPPAHAAAGIVGVSRRRQFATTVRDVTSHEARPALTRIRRRAVFVRPEVTIRVGRDASDDKFLECAISGDADYILKIRARDLDEFAQFIHRHLLPNPQVSLVRSDIVLKTMKEDHGLPIGGN